MPAPFSRDNLEDLLAFALSRKEKAPYVLLRVAIGACAAAGVPVRDLLPGTLPRLIAAQRCDVKTAFRALARVGHVDDLTILIRDPSPYVRLAVVHAVHYFGGRAYAETFATLLSDPDERVRTRAKEAIAEIHRADFVPWPHEVVDGPLSDDDHIIARLMLGETATILEVAALARLLSSESTAIREAARRALDAHGQIAADVLTEQLSDALGSGEELTREAVEALRDLGDDRAIGLLIRALENSTRNTRQYLSDALIAIGARAVPLFEQAFDRSPTIRARDGVLLARVAGSAAVERLTEGLFSPLRAVRESAENGLIALGGTNVPPLLDLLRRASSEPVIHALRVLAAGGDPRAFAAIVALAGSADARVAAAAIGALRKFENPTAFEAVARAARASDWRLRRAALEVIGHWDWRNHEAVAFLSDAVHDADSRVRDTAARSLHRLAGLQYAELDAHIRSLEALSHDSDHAIKTSATRGLEQLRGLVSVFQSRPLISSPEGSQERRRLRKRIEEIVSLEDQPTWNARFAERSSSRAVLGAAGDPATRDFTDREIPAPITDEVHFSVTCPLSVARRQTFVLDVWAYLAQDYPEVLDYVARDPRLRGGATIRSKGPVPVARGTTLTVTLSVPDFDLLDEDVVYWGGRLGNASFILTIPEQAGEGDHGGQIGIHAAGLQIARLSFLLNVAPVQGPVVDATSQLHRITSAYAWYATEDRHDVLARIQGMLKVVPDLDVFVDVLSLRSGENWRQRLEAAIVDHDVFYLFWSSAASQSTWVDWEWRTALRTRGLECIAPVPLETPDKAPPPPELASLHFNDWTLQFGQLGNP